MPLDYNILNKQTSLLDAQKLQQAFELQKATQAQALGTGAIDQATKQNALKYQTIAAGAANGADGLAAAKAKLGQLGIDASEYSDDPTIAAKQALTGQQVSSPYGTLFNAQQKVLGNDIAATAAFGTTNNPYAQTVPSLPGNPGVVSNITPTVPSSTNVVIPSKPTNVSLNTINDNIDAPGVPITPGAPIQTPQPAGTTVVTPPGNANNSPVFVFRAKDPNETQAAFNSAKQDAFEAYKASPDYIQQKAQSESVGKGIGDTTIKAGTATALSDRVMQGLDAMDTINESGKLPYAGNIIGPDTQTAISNRFGANPIANAVGINQDAANSSQAFTKVNKQQVIVGLQDMLAAAPQGSRLSRQLLQLVNDANGIDTNASQDSIRNQIGILRNEVQNIGISESNTLGNLTGGQQRPYNTIPTETPAPNAVQTGFLAKKYPDPDSIKAAYKSGDLTKDQATQLLTNTHGFTQ